MSYFKNIISFIILFIAFLVPETLVSQVVINEYSCSNLNGLTDEYGNREDWVEFYNAGGSAVNLTGYYLSDQPANPLKWQFPAGVSISAGGRLVVICSNKNTFGGTYYHTNFKLTQTKPESILFSDASGVLLENILLAPTLANHSRGRAPDGAVVWSVFTSPTPNTANSPTSADYTATPVFSQIAGFYPGTVNLTITCSTPGATIRYTTNGNEPTAASTIYTVPLNISTTQVIRAKAFGTNPSELPGIINSNTYFINVNHSVAVISIFGNDVSTLLNGSQIDADAGLEYFDKSLTLRAEATGTSNKHGNDSWFYNQRGFDFVSKDQYGTNYALRWKLFSRKNRNEYQRIIVKALANDNYPFENGAHIRDPYVHTLSQWAKLRMDERTYEPCVVYVNGQYWGLYDMREKVDDSDFIDYYHNSDVPNIQMLKTWGGTWSEYGGAQAQTDWNNLSNFIQSNNMAVPANYNYVDSLLSVKSLIDYFVLNSYVVCSDWLNWNTQWWRGINPNANKRKWRYTLWDEDATFGHYINYTGVPTTGPTADPCNPENLGNPGGQGHVPILNALMNNPDFYQYYVTRFADLANTHFRCDSLIYLLDSLVNQFQPEMAGQIARWGGNMGQWQQNVQTMRNFINSRCAALTQGMVDCYNLTGPYNINFSVTPPGSGTITVNSIDVPVYPWTGVYYGNIPTLLTATANPGYAFDYWEITVNTPSPSALDSSVSTTFTSSQDVIAHFKSPEPPLVVTSNVIQPMCSSDIYGSIDLSVSGGTSVTGNYNYIWSNGAVTQDLNNVPIGTYFVTVTDDDSCSVVQSFNITAPQPISMTTSPNVTLCNGETAVLSITASGGTPPYSYFWNGSIGNSTLTITPVSGITYAVSVTDNFGCPGQSDTIVVSVSPPVRPEIFFNNDTVCPGTQILVVLQIFDGAGGPYQIYDGSFNLITTPITFTPYQTQVITIWVKDVCGSMQSDSDTIYVHQLPDVNFSSVPVQGCSPLVNCFENLTSPQPQGQSYLWNFTNTSGGFVSTQVNPCITFYNSGNYDISLQVTTPDGCVADTTHESVVEIFDKPNASFSISTQSTSILNPVVYFTNLSSSALYWYWDFGDSTGSSLKNPYHRYNREGEFLVTLIAVSDKGCSDTAILPVVIHDETTLYAPTAFTPGHDKKNDEFRLFGLNVENFQIYIYSRWNQIIFESKDINEGWDGKFKGKYLPAGVYAWIASYNDYLGRYKKVSGSVTLIR